jgi:hypothetical protein
MWENARVSGTFSEEADVTLLEQRVHLCASAVGEKLTVPGDRLRVLDV